MLINFKRDVLDLDGKPYKDGDKELTLATVAQIALTTPTDKNRDLSLADKQHRANIAIDIHTQGKVDLPSEDVTKIKEAISGMHYNFLILKACCDMMDPPKVEGVKTGD